MLTVMLFTSTLVLFSPSRLARILALKRQHSNSLMSLLRYSYCHSGINSLVILKLVAGNIVIIIVVIIIIIIKYPKVYETKL